MDNDELWTDGLPMYASISDCRILNLRTLRATATSTWNSKHRKEAANKGIALPDGSYPIKDVADLKKAIQAIGRAKSRGRVVRHIKKRAKALGQMALVKDLKEKT